MESSSQDIEVFASSHVQIKMKILLINPLVERSKIYGSFKNLAGALPPLGLAYIAAVLEQSGHSIQIIDANVLMMPNDKVVDHAVREKPDIIGITTTTPGYYCARDLACKLKMSDPYTTIVLGGPHVQDLEFETMKEQCFDYIVTGEGEITMSELVRSLHNDYDISKVHGITYRQNGDIKKNQVREMISNLDELPFPSRHLLPDLNLYKPKAVSYKRLPTTQIFTSRGCPYKCIFCKTSFGNKVRFHSPEYVISEIELLVEKYSIRGLIINDDTFTLDKERVHRICDLIIEKRIDIVWSANVRANTVDKKVLEKMKKAGCWQVAIGIESGNPEILRILQKGINIQQAVSACKWAYELGLVVRPSFIIGSPLETLRTIEDTIQLAKSLPVHYPSFTMMTPFPGTEMWEKASEYGIFDKKAFNKLSVSSVASFIPRGLTEQEMIRKQKEAYMRVYLQPKMILRHLRHIRTKDDIKKMWGGLIDLFSNYITR